MDRQLDVLFVHPGGGQKIYQALRSRYSCVETPTWSLLLAQSCRAKGRGVAILDCDADNLTDEAAVARVKEFNPRLAVFEVYGSEPNQGTVKMAGAAPLADLLKKTHPDIKTCFVGTHTQASPREVLALPGVDFVLLNEGVYALNNLLLTDMADEVRLVKGVGWKDKGSPVLNTPEQPVPQARMDADLPGYAWDLVDFTKYRSHFWFGDYQPERCTPYAALYTSLGCVFKCSFCVINSLNRVDNAPGVTAANSAVFRHWSPAQTLSQIEYLVDHGVRTIRISDEMFYLKPSHYTPLLEGIQSRWGDALRLWCYARVDTVKKGTLSLFRSAGVRWICLGIESGNTTVRREVAKGSYEEVDVRQVVKEVEDAGIDVIANFIAGLPGDTLQTMEESLALACELNTAMYNIYPAMALPGSPLYEQARRAGVELPGSFEAFGFLSYECTPLPTDTLSAADVLRFRDEAFARYWSRPEFLSKIEGKFGAGARANIEGMLKVKLKRKLLGD